MKDIIPHVYLLDQYLAFDGTKGMSPVVQDMAIELAVTGVSYRQAGKALEKLLGYPVISHEGIRQQLLNTEVVSGDPVPLEQDVLFVEVDGLYTKSQEKKKKGRELKIAAVHQGWEVNLPLIAFISPEISNESFATIQGIDLSARSWQTMM